LGDVVLALCPSSRHGEYEAQIAVRLQQRMRGGRAIVACPVQTAEGVKVLDAGWISNERRASRDNDPAYVIAPEICVKVVSAGDNYEQLGERMRLFFEKGAQEFWSCGVDGEMTFLDPSGKPQS